MLIIVGSGRCGTKAFAEFYDALHEPNQDPVVQLASSYSHGYMDEEQVAAILSMWEWPKVWADYKQSELINVTSIMDPGPRYLWVTRNPADTVASMVRKGWYKPWDDWYPIGSLKVYRQIDGKAATATMFNDAGNRTRGDLVGDYTTDEWASMGQVERCGWWWNWVNRRIAEQAARIPERVMLCRLEDAVAMGPALGERLLGYPKALPVANESPATPVSGWEPYVGEMASALGYEIS